MSKAKRHKKSRGKHLTEKILLATAVVELVRAIIELIHDISE